MHLVNVRQWHYLNLFNRTFFDTFPTCSVSVPMLGTRSAQTTLCPRRSNAYLKLSKYICSH